MKKPKFKRPFVVKADKSIQRDNSHPTRSRSIRNMKVANLKSEKPFTVKANKNIQWYGEKNDFPQKVKQILESSITGRGCFDVLTKFVVGKGIEEPMLRNMIVDGDGNILNDVLKLLKTDYARWGGFAIHGNYNAIGQIVSLSHVPFENIRLDTPNKDTGEVMGVYVHQNWTGEFDVIKKFNQKDAIFYPFFNPDINVVLQEVESARLRALTEPENKGKDVNGWDYYNGQILYFSSAGDKIYPTPFYEPAVTDMSSEEGLSNVINRNVNNNFFPAGLIVEKVNNDQSDEEQSQTESMFKEMQGSTKAAKLAYVAVEDIESIKLLPFKGNNYDKEFSQTQEVVPNNIGRSFSQPPILRGVDIGAGFGSGLMGEAYKYYNSYTSDQRTTVDDKVNLVLRYWFVDMQDKKVVTTPLTY